MSIKQLTRDLLRDLITDLRFSRRIAAEKQETDSEREYRLKLERRVSELCKDRAGDKRLDRYGWPTD